MKKRKAWLWQIIVILLVLFNSPNITKAGNIETLLEVGLGHKVASDLENQYGISNDVQSNARLQNIALRIAPLAPREGIAYQFKVLNSYEVNACAAPGGFVFVNQGLMNITGLTDDELAFIIGHEIAHVKEKHGVKQFLVGMGISILLGKDKSQAISETAPKVIALIFISGRSRDNEKEADARGVELMEKAGYDPAGGLAFMRRLETLSEKTPDPIKRLFATHPSTSSRSEFLKDYLIKSKTGFFFKADIAYAATFSIEAPQTATFRFPLDNYQINGYHFEPAQFVKGWGYHLGEDANDTKRSQVIDTPVYAPAVGVVRDTAIHKSYGNVVIIEHKLPPQDPYGEYVCTINAHMHKIQVSIGQIVQKGQLLGYLAPKNLNGGWAPHDHFGIRKDKWSYQLDLDGQWRYRGYAPNLNLKNQWIWPTRFIQDHQSGFDIQPNPQPQTPRDKILLEQGPKHLGDDETNSKTIWLKEFVLNVADLAGRTKAEIHLRVKGMPRKDPVVYINRQKIGYAVTNTDKWQTFNLPFDPKILQVGNNLIDLETIIADLHLTYDDCEFADVYLLLE